LPWILVVGAVLIGLSLMKNKPADPVANTAAPTEEAAPAAATEAAPASDAAAPTEVTAPPAATEAAPASDGAAK
jgi:hypothetical protein